MRICAFSPPVTDKKVADGVDTDTMDFATNQHVQNGYNSLLNMLGEMGFRYGTYLWDPTYKGLDDYIWEHCFQRRKSQ